MIRRRPLLCLALLALAVVIVWPLAFVAMLLSPMFIRHGGPGRDA